MPPVVEGEGIVVLRPVSPAPFHEGDAFVLACLHLHHVAERVLGPAVVRLQRERLPAALLRRAVVAAFLQAEGGHAEQEAVSRVLPAVGRQGAGDTAAQIVPLALEEVGEMADLEGHHIARLVGDDPVEPCRHPVPVARGPVRNRRNVGPFALRGLAREGLEAAEACFDLGQHALLPEHGVQLGPENVAGDEVRVVGQRPVDGLDGIAPIALELAYRRLQNL